MIAGLENISGGEIAHRRQGRQPGAAQGTRHRDGVPELRALSAHDGARQHGVLAQSGQDAEGRDRRARQAGGRHPRPRRRCSIAFRASSRAASASAWRWAARSCATRRCSCSTSRCPTSTPSCAWQMRTEIKELHQRLKTTSIYVTHDQIEAMTMADQIVVMHDGRVEQIGSPLELYDRPANRFVAGFIGSPAMNFIDGTPERRRHRRGRQRCAPAGAARRGGDRRPRGGLRHPARAPGHRRRRLRGRGRGGRAHRLRNAAVRAPRRAGAGRRVPRAPRVRSRASRSGCARARDCAHLFDPSSGQRI